MTCGYQYVVKQSSTYVLVKLEISCTVSLPTTTINGSQHVCSLLCQPQHIQTRVISFQLLFALKGRQRQRPVKSIPLSFRERKIPPWGNVSESGPDFDQCISFDRQLQLFIGKLDRLVFFADDRNVFEILFLSKHVSIHNHSK